MASPATVHCGDCLDVLSGMADASIDAICTDPPYGLGFMGHAWDQPGVYAATRSNGTQNGGQWNREGRTGPADRGSVVVGSRFQAWTEAWGAELLRVASPGAHAVVFGSPRTFHRLVSGMEDAGWEIRDTLMWLFGSGMPKSHNLHGEHEGWGSGIKPAYEPILLARKPLTGTIAANMDTHGVGALHIDACRIEGEDADAGRVRHGGGTNHVYGAQPKSAGPMPSGRWPANVVVDEAAAGAIDGQTGVRSSGTMNPHHIDRGADGSTGIYGARKGRQRHTPTYGDQGGVSRFLYQAKASALDRGGAFNSHPTVKPVELIRWLIRLTTPPGGTVLDPFAGSGTTGVAALIEGAHPVLIEREAEYIEIINRRLAQPIETSLFGGAA